MARNMILRHKVFESALAVVLATLVVVLVGCGGGGSGAPGAGNSNTSGLGGSAGQVSTQSAGTGTVSGRIIDGTTGQGLFAATVTIGSRSGVTDANGDFVLTSVAAGTQLIAASKTGYSPRTATLFIGAGQIVTTNLVMFQGSSGGGGGTATGEGPRINSSNPMTGTSDVDPNTQIIFTLDQAVVRSTLSTNVNGSGLPSVVFTRISTPSANDSGVATVQDFGLLNTFVYRPGTLAPLQPNSQYGLFINNRLVGVNGLAAPGSNVVFNTRLASGSGSGSGSGAVNQPRLVFTNPGIGSSNIDPRTRILFAFDQAMLDSTITVTPTRSIIFARTTIPTVEDTIGYSIRRATDIAVANIYEYIPGPSIKPLANLTTYTVFITNGVQSTANIPSAGESFSFQIKPASSGSGPTILSANPTNGTTGVDPSTRLFVTLSSDVDGTTVTPLSVKLTRLTSPVQDLTISLTPTCATVVCTNVFEIVPQNLPLDGDSTYQISVNNNLVGQSGVRSTGAATTFRTRSSGSGSGSGGVIQPILISSNPSNLATQVDLNTRVLLTFNADMLLSSFNVTNAVQFTQLSAPTADLGQTVVVSAGVANTFEVLNNATGLPFVLSSLRNYRVTLSNQIKASGSSGGFLQPTFRDFTTRFVQGGVGDTSPPFVAATNPTDNTTQVPTSSQIFFSFNEAVLVSTVTAASVNLTQITSPTSQDSGALPPVPLNATETFPGSGIFVASDFRYQFGNLAISPGLTFRLFFNNAIQDPNGNRLNPEFRTFTTSAIQNVSQGPKFSSSNPSNGQLDVDPSNSIIFTLDKDIEDPNELNPPSFSVTTTVNPNNLILVRAAFFDNDPSAASQNEQDRTTGVPVPLNPPLTFPVFSGSDAATGFTTAILPAIYRPDPVNFRRTYIYIPGTLGHIPESSPGVRSNSAVHLIAGLSRYTFFLTNNVVDFGGNRAQGSVFNFTTRDPDVKPAGGPRLIGTNPGNGSITGPNAPIFLTFDKELNPNTLAGAIGLSAYFNAQDCGQPPFSICNPSADGQTLVLCQCSNLIATTNVTFAQFGVPPVPDNRVLRVDHVNFPTGVLGTIVVTVNGQLQSVDGQPSAGDFIFFFSR